MIARRPPLGGFALAMVMVPRGEVQRAAGDGVIDRPLVLVNDQVLERDRLAQRDGAGRALEDGAVTTAPGGGVVGAGGDGSPIGGGGVPGLGTGGVEGFGCGRGGGGGFRRPCGGGLGGALVAGADLVGILGCTC